jgi:hypothetical protein
MTADPPTEITTPTPTPPLQSALHRLEHLFGGGRSTANIIAPQSQAKLLKKWLGSASGSAQSATLEDISQCAALLDPNGPCATGRELLLHLSSGSGMDIERADATYLVVAAREGEAYLLTLAVRNLWRQRKYSEAYELSNKGLNIIDTHLRECEGKILDNLGVGGLYPLRSRMVRYRSLVGECMDREGDAVRGMREDLALRYRMAVLAKDGDGICTVLNLMLRDLLGSDEGEFCVLVS